MQKYTRQDKIIYPIEFQKELKEFDIIDSNHTDVNTIYYASSNHIYHNLACKCDAKDVVIS